MGKSNKEVRKEYDEKVKNIPNLLDYSKTLEEQAVQAFELRNAYRKEARNEMENQEERAILEKVRPNLTFDDMVKHKMLDKHLSLEDAYRDIISSASITNKEVDDRFKKE
jgi:filamentous hemagglutinin